MFAWTTDLIIGMPIVLLIIIFISYIIRKTLKNKSERVRNYPLKIVAMVILILEIVKQVENVVTGFDPWAIPLHFCSLFVFFCPLAQFGTKKSKSFMKPVAFICAITMCLAFYTAPQWIIGKNAFMNFFNSFSEFHTVVFHHLVVLYAALTIALNDYVPKKKDYINLIVVMNIFLIIAIPFSYILDTNYCNILETTVPLLVPFQEYIGQVLYTLFIYIILNAGTALVSYWYYLGYNKITKKESN